jgi:hypothetical protein
MRFACLSVGKTTSNKSLDLDLQSSDVVFLAALVGATIEEKKEILVNLAKKMRIGSVLVVRTAKGLRGVLYPVSPILLLFFLAPNTKQEHEVMTCRLANIETGLRCFNLPSPNGGHYHCPS